MGIMLNKYLLFAFMVFVALPLCGLDLDIEEEDTRIEQWEDGGFHLFIRKKSDIASVLITESTKDPEYQEANYAYYTPEWNAVNGDEIRIINGLPLSSANKRQYLVASKIEKDERFGEAFHIYIPYTLYYGYENRRRGEIFVEQGTYFNLRAFALPYADYDGAFQDNPFVLDLIQDEAPELPEGVNPDVLRSFSSLSDKTGGRYLLSSGAEDVLLKIQDLLAEEKGKNLDLVICVDTTGSMKKHIDAVKKMLAPLLTNMRSDFPAFRVGMVLYQDYYASDYVTRIIPFTGDMNELQRRINGITTRGGGDIPEAVYNALYDGALKFPWEAQSRIIILIGDAPPPPAPRALDKVTQKMAEDALAGKSIKVNTIMLPVVK
jgi:hypothetical protein